MLGLRVQKARTLRWVAQKLEALPVLSRAGERGEVGWSKLREVVPSRGRCSPNGDNVRKASAETEGFWLEFCRLKTYREIERLVRCTPRGAIPGDLPNEDEQEPAVTELRLRLGLAAEAIVSRGLQLYSLQQSRPVPLAEAVELLFSQLLQKGEVGGRSSAAEDLDHLAKSQKEARKDLLAAALGREPLVREARELAQAMGVINSDSVTGPDSEASLPLQEIYSELMESSRQAELAGEAGSPARGIGENHPPEIDHPKFPAREIPADTEEWAKVLAAYQQACPGNEEVSLLARDLGNSRLRYNPQARQATPAQRRELLRRDGYCCTTPGCTLKGHNTLITSGWSFITSCSIRAKVERSRPILSLSARVLPQEPAQRPSPYLWTGTRQTGLQRRAGQQPASASRARGSGLAGLLDRLDRPTGRLPSAPLGPKRVDP